MFICRVNSLWTSKSLQEANAALRAVLARIEEQKQEIYKDLQANVDKILMPILHEMALHLPATQRQYAELLRTYLENIVSPFVNNLSKTHLSLTTTEVSICNMIRSGLQTKEIAKMRGVSVGTINRHREHIRRKLVITNSDINLATYLQSSMGKIDWKYPQILPGRVRGIRQTRRLGHGRQYYRVYQGRQGHARLRRTLIFGIFLDFKDWWLYFSIRWNTWKGVGKSWIRTCWSTKLGSRLFWRCSGFSFSHDGHPTLIT